MSRSSVLAALVLAVAQQAGACNPEPPVAPIMAGHDYDAVAMEYLIRDADSIVVGRYTGRLDIMVRDADSEDASRVSYLFELTDGWKGIRPRSQAIGGYWVSCELQPQVGTHYLMFMAGAQPLHIVAVRDASAEFEELGDFDWFYDTKGELIRNELVKEIPDADEESAELPAS